MPSRLIAPEPSPCIAKAKSASPDVPRQRLADQAHRAGIDRLAAAAMSAAGHRMAQPAGLAERAHQRPAVGVDIGAMVVRQVLARPALERVRQLAVARLEERPVEVGGIAHRAPAQLPSNTRLLLRDEGLVGAREIAGQHAERLRLRLGLDRLVDRHRPLLVQHRLGDAVGEGRARSELARQRLRIGEQRLGCAQPVEEAPALGLLAAERAAGVQQFAGAALADDARQHRAGAHVAAGQADPVEQERGLAARGAQAQVGRHRDDRAGAGAHAVDAPR